MKKISGFILLNLALFTSQYSAASISYEQFKSRIEQDSTGVYIVEGDLPLHSERQLRQYFEYVVKPLSGNDQSTSNRLIINRIDGLADKWPANKKNNLTYCVSRRFGNMRGKVISAMLKATKAWSSKIDVDFIFKNSANCNSNSLDVVFDVSPSNPNATYLARAFFPSYPRSTRNILISPSAMRESRFRQLNLTGILRHELGHVLGFRHEHTRPESQATSCFEDNNWIVLTSYDSKSVMHYPQCNGTGGWGLNITASDIAGAQSVYGKKDNDKKPVINSFNIFADLIIYLDGDGPSTYNVSYSVDSNADYCTLRMSGINRTYRLRGKTPMTEVSTGGRSPGNRAYLTCFLNGRSKSISKRIPVTIDVN